MIYRQACIDDGSMIVRLNRKYCEAYRNGTSDKGFLRNVFNLIEVRELILASQVVVAQIHNEVVGYYLVNGVFETPVIARRQAVVQEFISSKVLPEGRYVFLTQAVVDRPYMGQGVAKKLLTVLKQIIEDRFDFMVGYIDFENKNAKDAHSRSGWRVFAELENGWLAITPVKSGRDMELIANRLLH